MANNPFEDYTERFYYEITHEGKEKKSAIEIRLDPLLGPYSLHSTSISEARANKPENFETNGQVAGEKEPEVDPDCPFCPQKIFSVTPEPRIIHGDLVTIKDDSHKVITVPNLYPFSVPHYVTIFSKHRPDLRKLGYDELINYMESGYFLAREMKGKKGVEGMWDIINWGPTAAASQPHPHAQRGGVRKTMIVRADKEAEGIERLVKETGKDPFAEYMAKVRDSPYFIFENNMVQIHAPFAPRFPDQVDVICKKKASNILDLEIKEERDEIARTMLGIFHALREKRGVTDLNLIMHQDRFGKNGSYRLHWHVMPRNKNKLGGLEIGDDINVVFVYPEKTAEILKRYYSK